VSNLPYRPNVGAVLFNRSGLILVARRADLPNAEAPAGGWQLPQGGIDEGEDPRQAVLRELAEEIGTDRAEVIGEHDEWLTYDLPPQLLGIALKGRFRGQRQRCDSPGRTATSGWIWIRTRSSTRGGGRGWRNCRVSRWRGSGRFTRCWWRVSRVSPAVDRQRVSAGRSGLSARRSLRNSQFVHGRVSTRPR